MSLCESIREVLEEQAQAEGFARVNRIWLDVGPLSCVEPEALRFGFDVVMRGSLAAGAALEIASPPATARCLACGEVATVKRRYEACPKCKAPGLEVTSGDELKIRKLEVA